MHPELKVLSAKSVDTVVRSMPSCAMTSDEIIVSEQFRVLARPELKSWHPRTQNIYLTCEALHLRRADENVSVTKLPVPAQSCPASAGLPQNLC